LRKERAIGQTCIYKGMFDRSMLARCWLRNPWCRYKDGAGR